MVSQVTASSVAGYQGKINDQTYPLILGNTGPRQVVEDGLDPTASASERKVTIAAGQAQERGVRCVFSAAMVFDIPVPGTGGQWYMIAIHRRTADRLAEIVILPGPTGSDADAVAVPTTFVPTGFVNNPGVETHQPLVWAYSRVGRATVQIWDLRLIHDSAGGAFAKSFAGLLVANSYLLRDGARIAVANHTMRRGGSHYRSTWQRVNGTGNLEPVGEILTSDQALGGFSPLTTGTKDDLIDLATGGYTPGLGFPAGTILRDSQRAQAPLQWMSPGQWKPLPGTPLLTRRWRQWDFGPWPRGDWWDFPLDLWRDPYGLGGDPGNGFRAPADGWYRVEFLLGLTNSYNGRLIVSAVKQNGAEQWSSGGAPYQGDTPSSGSMVIDGVTKGDLFKFRLYNSQQNTDNWLRGSTNSNLSTTFTVFYLGENS